MGNYFTQLNFTQIAGQPHDIPEKAIDKLVTFTGTDASTSTEQHLRYFSKHCGAYVRGTDKHEDVYMTLFALSLDGKAGNWYDNLPNNSFTTIADFKSAFLEKIGSKKEPRHLVATLTSVVRRLHTNNRNFPKAISSLRKVGEV